MSGTGRRVWGVLGVLALFALGLGGGALLSRHLTTRKDAGAVPKLSQLAAPPGQARSDPAARPPIGLSPVPVDEPRGGSPGPGQPAQAAARIPWAEPYPAPAFALTDQEGRPVSLGDFAGQVVLMNFIYTSCTATCPLETQELRQLQQALGPLMGRDVVFLSVTIDPRRDTPEVLKRYAAGHGADLRSWKFLTGPEPRVREVLEAYRVPVRVETRPGAPAGHYELGHGNPIYLIDQWARVRKRTAPTMLVQIGRPAIEWLVQQGAGDAPGRRAGQGGA